MFFFCSCRCQWQGYVIQWHSGLLLQNMENRRFPWILQGRYGQLHALGSTRGSMSSLLGHSEGFSTQVFEGYR